MTEAITAVIGETVREAQENTSASIDPEVVVSLATYLRDGRPTPSLELYDRLSGVDFRLLAMQLTRLTGLPLRVRFMHDGTAAAAGLPTIGAAGVIVLGSSLGAGFTVPGQPRLPIAANLLITRRTSSP